MAQKNNNRLEWIDALRGLAMLLVIWGHIARTEHLFFLLTSPFKMPLFFAIMGYVFNDRKGDTIAFFKNLLMRIIVPWLILSLIWLKIGYAILGGNPERIPRLIYDLFSGESFWFMPCCVICEVITFFLRKFVKEIKLQYLVMAVLAVIGLIMSRYGIGDFAMINVALISQIYMLFGYWFKNCELTIRNRMGTKQILAVSGLYAALIVFSAIAFPGKVMNVHTSRYYSYPLCFFLVFASLLVLFTAVPAIKRFSKWLLFVGQNTLVFYILHVYARLAIQKAFSVIGYPLSQGFFDYLIRFILVCVMMTIAAMVINRYLPFAAGKKSRKTQTV